MIDNKIIYLIHLLTEDRFVTLSDKVKFDNALNKLIKILESFDGVDEL